MSFGERKTPMKRGTTPMKSDPAKTKAWHERSQPIERTEMKRTVRNTGPSQKVRDEVKRRERSRCRRCKRVTAEGDIHHRQPRGMGGTSRPEINDAVNLVWLCDRCHDYIEDNRDEAYLMGWLVHRGTDPASVPWREVGWGSA